MRISKRLSVLAVAFVTMISSGTALAAPQSKAQQKCINAMNKGMAKVAGTELKAVAKCTADYAKGKNADAQACYTTSTKVDTAQSKLCTSEPKKCTETPDFAYTGCNTAGGNAEYWGWQYAAEVFGEFDVNAGITPCSSDKAGCKCQAKALKAANKVYATRLKTFNTCKKNVLKDKTSPASTETDVSACLDLDPKQKIDKAVFKLGGAITKKCGTVATPFATGDCMNLTGSSLASCLDARTRCAACLTVQGSDNLFLGVDCDLYDDADNGNSSCLGDF